MEGVAQNELILIFIAGGLGMLSLAGGLVLFVLFYQKRMLRIKNEQQRKEAKYQRELLYSSIQSQENERRRIARELHDEVGALLSTVKLSMAVASKKIEQDQNPDEANRETKKLLNETIESVRRISKDLLPHTLQEFGLIAAIKSLQQQINHSDELSFTLTGELLSRLSSEQELALFRIVQELINNTLKHAQASQLSVVLEQNQNGLRVHYCDDGIGFKTPEISPGIGLKNIRSRAELIGATVQFESSSKTGSQTYIYLPTPTLRSDHKKPELK